MKMRILIKIFLTVFLLLLVILPIGYFLIIPNYNTTIGKIQRIDIQRYTYDTFFSLFTNIAPTKDRVLHTNEDLVLGSTIEEYLADIKLVDYLLEDLNSVLKIDSISVEGKIHQGEDGNTMDKGFWHFPASVYPGQKGNTVIISHRYLKLPPSKDTFFNLDKVKVGDTVVVEQIDDTFRYIVTDVHIVEKNDISVLKSSDEYEITLITCTPLWTSQKRLVINGKLDKLYQKT
jgi:LPXTG-site transpeptidase (sortase) family protein